MRKPRNAVVKTGTFPVYLVYETKRGDALIEPILGGDKMLLDGKVMEDLRIRVDGVFAQITVDVDGVLYWVNVSLNTRSTLVMLGNTRLGLIVDAGTYLAISEDTTNKLRHVPIDKYPVHARLLAGAFLLWNYLVLKKFVEQQPTH